MSSTKNRNIHVRKKDLSSHQKKLKRINPELFLFQKIAELHKKGKNIRGMIKNPYVEDPYVRALLTLRDLDYPIKASDIANLCDISKKSVKVLVPWGYAEVVRTDFKRRSFYVITEPGVDFLKCSGVYWMAKHYSPGFYDRSIGDLKRTTKRRLIPGYLKKDRSVLKHALGVERVNGEFELVFDYLWDMYNNPLCNPMPRTINKDLNHIYGVLKQINA